MKILLIGQGGREHALAWRLRKSDLVEHIYVTPGNGGTLREPKIDNIDISPLDFPALIKFAQENDITYTLVGPEVPLVHGIVDAFKKAGLLILGPDQYAAQLEGSKSFAKDFMHKYHIPTAQSQTFTDFTQAKNYLGTQSYPIVIKADGLAAGKGVVIAQTEAEAIFALENFLEKHTLGDSGNTVVIEEFIEGEEASFIVLSDGENLITFPSSQDHKARDDGDLGPNTGGMGAYAPAPVVTPELHQQVIDTVMKPVLEGMKKEGHPYVGFLYAGLMIDKNNHIKVLEFNCRFGDPETQPIMMLVKSDFAELCLKAIEGKLDTVTPEFKPLFALTVVLTSAGYPNDYEVHKPISGLNIALQKGERIFHAGTKLENGEILSTGGRVLCVSAVGESVKLAHAKVYNIIKKINFDGMFYRTDIGYRAMMRELEE